MKLHPHMPDPEYRSLAGISYSTLKSMLRSPAHYRQALDTPMKPTPDMILGTLAHEAILTPDIWKGKWASGLYATVPDGMDKRTKAYKVWRATIPATTTMIDADSIALIEGMARSIAAHPIASEMVQYSATEQTYTWDDRITGLGCKCRVDGVYDVCDIAWDLKTTRDASVESFSRVAGNFQYHLQAAFYGDAASAHAGHSFSFHCIVVERDPPHGVMVYEFDDDAMFVGRDRYQWALTQVKKCKEQGFYPAYPTTRQVLSLPKWHPHRKILARVGRGGW